MGLFFIWSQIRRCWFLVDLVVLAAVAQTLRSNDAGLARILAASDIDRMGQKPHIDDCHEVALIEQNDLPLDDQLV